MMKLRNKAAWKKEPVHPNILIAVLFRKFAFHFFQ
jgi:hypothetical protein